MNFHRLVVPVFIAVAVSITAFIAVVFVAATLQDEATLKAERQVVSQNLASVHLSLAVVAQDNAWWDEAVTHISIKEDIDWIDRTIGESVNGIKEIQGVLILKPDASLIYANYVEDLPPPHALIEEELASMVASLPEPDPGKPLSRSGFLMVQGQLMAFGASLVQPAGFRTFEEGTLNRPLPVIIFLTRLTDQRLTAMGVASAIESLALAPAEEAGTTGMLPIGNIRGETVGHLNWKTSEPGSRMIEKMLLPAAVLLLIVTAALVRFVRQANKLVAALESANRAKSAFLASTSHEIRTPLNAILGFTELISLELYGRVEGEKNKEYLSLIRESGEHLLSIINDILDISKLEADRFEIYAEKVDPVLVIDASCKIIQPQATEKNIEIVTSCEAAELYSDERIMRQILINLLSNAVKFTKPGGRISVNGKVKDNIYRIRVDDTGIGMTEEELQKALALFGQVQSEYARDHTGTGLGLPLVSRFTDLLGGEFSIRSVPGEGTGITLDFPLYSLSDPGAIPGH